MYDQFQNLENVFITDGNVTDYDSIRRFVTGYHVEDARVKYDAQSLATRYNIQSIAFDRFNSSQCVLNLSSDGMSMAPFGQGFVSMSAPTKELERLMSEGRIHHGGCPVLRWMFGNVVLRMDPSSNLKPDKEKSGDKIDGVVALVMAIGQAMTEQSTPKTPSPTTTSSEHCEHPTQRPQTACPPFGFGPETVNPRRVRGRILCPPQTPRNTRQRVLVGRTRPHVHFRTYTVQRPRGFRLGFEPLEQQTTVRPVIGHRISSSTDHLFVSVPRNRRTTEPYTSDQFGIPPS